MGEEGISINMKTNQKEKLRQLLIYLYKSNLYYGNIMKEIGCNPILDDPINIYNALPYMDKTTLKNINEEILTSELMGCEEKFDYTSGTSGTIIKCYKTQEERNILALNIWINRKHFDNKVRPSNYISFFNRDIEERIGKFYDTNQDNMIKLFRKILEYEPRWISGPISIFEKLAGLIAEGIKFDITSLKVIEFMGEYVSEEKRRFVEKNFKCKTVNNYGAQEVWCMAFECEKHHLHIQENICILDFYKNSNELVVTSLVNRFMPIIKYRLGDVGKIESCVCNNKNDIVVLQGGRIGNLIVGTNILGDYFFDQLIWDINRTYEDSIYAFQAIQREVDNFELRLVKGSAYNTTIYNLLKKRMEMEFKRNLKVDVIFVDCIPFGRNGKMKKFIPYLSSTEN